MRKNTKAILLTVVLLLTFIAGLSGEAWAHPHRYPQFHRGGLTVGLSFGGGLVANDVPLSGAGWLGFRLGGVINRRLGLLFDHELLLFALDTPVGDELGYAGAATMAFQIYLDPAPIWLKFAGGLGYLGSETLDTNIGGALLAGLGIELLQVKHRRAPWALTLETQVVPLFLAPRGNNGAEIVIGWTAGLGFQWY